MSPHNDETGITLATKASPPIAVSLTNMFSDVTVPEIVNVITLIYLLVLLAHKAWSWHREWRVAKSDRRGKPRPVKDSHERRA